MGLTVDDKLSWNEQYKSVKGKVAGDRAIMTFKIVNQLCPEGLRNKFIERPALSRYNTRNMKDIRVQKMNLEYTKTS